MPLFTGLVGDELPAGGAQAALGSAARWSGLGAQLLWQGDDSPLRGFSALCCFPGLYVGTKTRSSLSSIAQP